MATAAAPRRLRIAALCCFTFPENIARERGQFDKIFAAWVCAAVEARNKKKTVKERVVVELKGWNIVDKDQYPDLNDIDALIVTGSTSSVYEDQLWIHQLSNFIQGSFINIKAQYYHPSITASEIDVYENQSHVKIYGGCFGHQIVSQALLSSYGLGVQKSPNGWQVGVHSVSLRRSFRQSSRNYSKTADSHISFFTKTRS
ncbi:hypothetical protein QQZ08_009111 [Neonectria magnoliae]|uniref:Glutamine amidotransferase domain-containing protein n=1 Tax=Neonectria magnoliae TaxID=2732573 RepID=A0ABR1HQJ2_9HYPO